MSNPIDVYVGARVRMTREFRGISLPDLARALDITCDALELCERGDGRFMATDLATLAEVLRVSPTMFFSGLKNLPRVPVLEQNRYEANASFANNNSSDENKIRRHLRLVFNGEASC